MQNLSIVRAKCYLILQGIERSLADNLVRNFEMDEPSFLNGEEQERALTRLCEDLQDDWGLDDVTTEDLVEYLDLGDLISLLNRHRTSVRNAIQSDIQAATDILTSRGIPNIRKRVMHPIRPLNPDDLSILLSISSDLPQESPSLLWDHLLESKDLIEDSSNTININIPPYWAEESTILHNLPVAEFLDTGFIGRRNERRQLKQRLESDHRVITVVGIGGIGKTALALRVCHDILEESDTGLDRMVWVSLKTKHLTPDGIREVSEAVDTTSSLIDSLLPASDANSNASREESWEGVLEHLRESRTLLVIDNLETLGSEVRELAVSIPKESKLLLTSRVGLGEIEVRYEMPNLTPKDAGALFRNLASAYNYTSLMKLSEKLLRQYCRRLYYNPLLIKWFVQAVGKGTSPNDVFAHEDFDQALRFCLENVYDSLSPLSRRIISTLLAARRELSQTQIQEILNADHVQLIQAFQELRQSNIIDSKTEEDGSVICQIGGLVHDYLARHAPPDSSTVKVTREQLRKWQAEQDRSASQRHTYRYNRRVVHVETDDQKVVSSHLRDTLNSIRAHNPDTAWKALQRAQELAPTWWEVYRVKAFLLEYEQRPTYQIEQAYEESINCNDIDIIRHHYAAYLLRIDEYERALDQIERALQHKDAEVVSLRSIRGLTFLRLGYIAEAIGELEYVWSSDNSDIPTRVRRIRGTQFADALRRHVEHHFYQGDLNAVEADAVKGVRVTDETADACGWDSKLARVGVSLLADLLRLPERPKTSEILLAETATRWDKEISFTDACRRFGKALDILEKNGELAYLIPNTYAGALSSDHDRRFTGTIDRIWEWNGYIQTDSMGEVYLNRSSLARPSEWQNLRKGMLVSFSVIHHTKGPLAVRLEAE